MHHDPELFRAAVRDSLRLREAYLAAIAAQIAQEKESASAQSAADGPLGRGRVPKESASGAHEAPDLECELERLRKALVQALVLREMARGSEHEAG